MKRTFFSAFVMAVTLFSLNCNKQPIKKGLNEQGEIPNWAMAKLKEQFGIAQFNRHSDQTANTKLIQGLKIPAGSLSRQKDSELANRSVEELASLLNFENTIELIFEDERVCYSIPFSTQPSMNLLVIGDNYTNLEDVDRVCIINYTVDNEGTGNIITTYRDIEITDVYSVGELVSSESEIKFTEELQNNADRSICQRGANETFRQCFDRLYDTICDGFWGCVAWYSHPAIPVITAAVCSCKK